MEQFLGTLKRHIAEHPPNFGDGNSVLTMLYECHSENNPYDTTMNGWVVMTKNGTSVWTSTMRCALAKTTAMTVSLTMTTTPMIGTTK